MSTWQVVFGWKYVTTKCRVLNFTLLL